MSIRLSADGLSFWTAKAVAAPTESGGWLPDMRPRPEEKTMLFDKRSSGADRIRGLVDLYIKKSGMGTPVRTDIYLDTTHTVAVPTALFDPQQAADYLRVNNITTGPTDGVWASLFGSGEATAVVVFDRAAVAEAEASTGTGTEPSTGAATRTAFSAEAASSTETAFSVGVDSPAGAKFPIGSRIPVETEQPANTKSPAEAPVWIRTPFAINDLVRHARRKKEKTGRKFAVVYLGAANAYLSVYAGCGGMLYCDTLPYSTPADVLYYLRELAQKWDLLYNPIYVRGNRSAEVVKTVRKTFKKAQCG